jgi:cytochrome oxidase Cu insertion factor (SCO1/SenC/PrrC family)
MRLNLRGSIAVAAVTLVAAVAGAYGIARGPEEVGSERRIDAARLMNDLMSGAANIGGAFTLADTAGRRVSLGDFRGKVVVLYFGYTFCPDVCPTDLSTIAAMHAKLGGIRDRVQPVFVTLDPERDKPAALEAYVHAFSPDIVALTGASAAIREVALAYRVFYEKVRQPGSKHYVIDHTAFTFVIDANGEYAGFLPPGTGAERMGTVVREVLKTGA